jgi:hypothetical protein
MITSGNILVEEEYYECTSHDNGSWHSNVVGVHIVIKVVETVKIL